jgi:hypothetical protein
MKPPRAYFDKLFSGQDDPWGMRSRYYEERKRAVTLAALPHPRYRRGFEPGCANGELSSSLATRCDELLVSDSTPRAFELAKERLRDFKHVRVTTQSVPKEWPEGRFDLIVLSEIGYFLERAELDELYGRATEALTEEGDLLLCHWRRPISGCELTGEEVHAAFGTRGSLAQAVEHREKDFLLDVFSRDPRSVGEREGLR